MIKEMQAFADVLARTGNTSDVEVTLSRNSFNALRCGVLESTRPANVGDPSDTICFYAGPFRVLFRAKPCAHERLRCADCGHVTGAT